VPSIDELIETHAKRVGIDPKFLRRVVKIESGGNPNNTTGSYHGLLQLSNREFAKNGGTGSIYDPEQNIMAGANKIAHEKAAFEARTGKPATNADLYGIHQQGEAGYAAHTANPEGIAWKNVRRFYGSDWMAKKAIWGNIPDSEKGKFGSVDNVTSGAFTGMWAGRVGAPGETTFSRRASASKQRHEGIPKDAGEPSGKPEENWTPYQANIPSMTVGEFTPDIKLRSTGPATPQ